MRRQSIGESCSQVDVAPVPQDVLRQHLAHGPAKNELGPAVPVKLLLGKGCAERDQPNVEEGVPRLDPDRACYPVVSLTGR
jgi:hypothetical protein